MGQRCDVTIDDGKMACGLKSRATSSSHATTSSRAWEGRMITGAVRHEGCMSVALRTQHSEPLLRDGQQHREIMVCVTV